MQNFRVMASEKVPNTRAVLLALSATAALTIWPTSHALSQPPPPPPMQLADCLPIIHFQADSLRLGKKAKKQLEDALECLALEPPGSKIELTGHTDTRGTDEYNLVRGAKYARVVADALIAGGIERDRILTKSRGESSPAVPKPESEEDHWANRRVVICVIPPTE